MKYALVVLEGRDVALRVDLPEKGSVTLGRGKEAQVRLNDDQASRKHCLIRSGPSGMAVFDLKSTGGVYINGERISRVHALRVGDKLTIGTTVLTVAEAGTPASQPDGREASYVCLSCGHAGPEDCPRCGALFLLPTFGIPKLFIERKLGTGGMGAVFLARRLDDDKPVALKLCAFVGKPQKGKLERFLREAKLPAKFEHGNVVRVYDTGTVIARPPPGSLLEGQAPSKAAFIVLEFVDGRDLHQIVREDGPMPVRDALRVGLKVANVLCHAYEHRIVHRDIKPKNIMLNQHRVVKVMDFGLAKSLEDAGLTDVTLSGRSFGTPAFMAPEQAQDAKRADHRADMYALGATLFFVLTGRKPFEGKGVAKVLSKVLHAPAPRLESFVDDAPPALGDFLARSMAKDPAERFDTPKAMEGKLLDIFQGLGQ